MTGYRFLVPDEQSNGSCAWLNRACRIAGLDPESARLLRMGSNAVYRLSAPVIVRISRPGADADGARRTVAVARWLESVGYPSVRAIDVGQPIVIDGHAVTFWQAVSDDGDEYASVGEVAQVLVELHRLVAPDDLRLPLLEPFDKAAKRIETNDWLSSMDRDFLTETLAQMRESYDELDFMLPQGVIHGDANVGNVLHDSDGNPVVIDLDGFSIGPREWDLALTAIYYDSFGWHTREEYETFARVYGFDIMKWSGYPVMRAVREFLMVPWVAQQAGESPRLAAEARKRISALRTGASRKDWEPY
jgi:aminoglycoside phosphotransferase (APT) family kinase protein